MRGLREVIGRCAAIGAATVILAGVVPAVTARPAYADRFTSSDYSIDASVGNTFGGAANSTSYKLVSSGGEAVVGDGSSGSYKLGSGYIAQLGQSIQLNVQLSSLLLHYPMDEASGTTLYDNAGGTLDASLVGSPGRVVGKLGQALSLDGSSTYAGAGGQRDLDADPGEARTFSAWFKAGVQSGRTFILDQFGTCTGWTVSLDTSGNVRLQFAADNSGCASPTTYTATTTGTRYDNNAWHHVMGVVDRPGGSLKVFMDGQSAASASGVNNTAAAASGTFVIGADGGFSNVFNGLIDEVKIFDKGFSNKDALREYTAQNSGVPSSLSFSDIVPNQSSSVGARTVVQTDAPGYTLAIAQDGNMTDGTHTISPVSGSITTPTLWTEGTTKGLGFALTSATGLDPKWGSNPNYKYAALPGSGTSIYTRSGYSGGTKDIVTTRYRLDVPLSQVAGDYKNTVTYTATIIP